MTTPKKFGVLPYQIITVKHGICSLGMLQTSLFSQHNDLRNQTSEVSLQSRRRGLAAIVAEMKVQ
jgi:hypothetical protein